MYVPQTEVVCVSSDDTIEEREWAISQEAIRETVAREEEIRWELAVEESMREERKNYRRDDRWRGRREEAFRPSRLKALKRFLNWLLGGEI
jgi:hypothetical protein